MLVGFHRLIGILAYHWHGLGALIKGQPRELVRGGKPNHEAMRAHKISDADLLEETRQNGNVSNLEEIQTATLERNGQVSIIHAKGKSG